MNRRLFLRAALGVAAVVLAPPPIRAIARRMGGPSIQEMIDRVGPGGGVVYLPSGIYRVRSKLRLPGNVVLKGQS